VQDDPLTLEVLAHLDEVALVGWQAQNDIKEKKQFFSWKLQKIEDEVGHFEERTAASLKETTDAQKVLDAIRVERAAKREEFEKSMAQLDKELIEAKAKNTSLYSRQLTVQEAGRKERHIQSGVTEANSEKLLALAVKKNRAIKQLRESQLDRQKAQRQLEEMQYKARSEQDMTALFQAELLSLEDEYTNLSKKVREYVQVAKKAKEKKAEDTDASVSPKNALSTLPTKT
jgi:chromosome segregation ATPase